MASKQFENLWAVILGGSGGFGLATGSKLASEGMNLVMIYRETASGQRLILEVFADLAKANNVRILPFNINALDQESLTNCVREILKEIPKKTVRLLMHSIARGNLKPLMAGDGSGELSSEDIQLTAYAMSGSLLDWTRALLNEELFHGDARVIGLTSEGARKYWPGYGAVSMAKASLESLVRHLAVELAPYGIRANLIQAGVTQTPSLERIPGSKELLELSARRNPMGRITRTSDVANVISLLCTDDAAWINGSLIHVDGGEHCC